MRYIVLYIRIKGSTMETVAVIEELQKTQSMIYMILSEIRKIKNKNPDDELVTVRQAHEITKISEQKIRQMMEEGKLETNDKYGRAKRIYRRSL